MFKRKLRISLYGGNEQTFYPGAQVAGKVELKSPSDDKISSLTVDLRGVTKILPRKGSQTREEHIELFHITEVLVSQPMFIEPRKPYSWNFTFALPFETGRDLSGKYKDGENSKFEEKPHSLPPSLLSDQSEEVRIEYQMYAVAKRPFRGVAMARDLQQVPIVHNIESLRYTPEVLSAESDVTREHSHTFQVYPPKKRKLSLKNPASVASAQQHPVRFMITASVPPMISLGEDVSVRYSLRHYTNLGMVEGPEKLQYYAHKSMSLSLRVNTHRRTALDPHIPSLTETKSKKLVIRPTAGGSPQDSAKFSTKEITDWPPSFKSYSIARTYDLLLEITVTDGKQDFEAKFETPVTIVKRVATGTLAARMASDVPPALPHMGPRGEDEELPPYQR